MRTDKGISRTDDKFRPALKGKKIPILTLDGKWHQLFTQAKADKRIRRLEEKLNELLKQQGKANTEMKEVRHLKKRLMQEIMDNASLSSSGNNEKAWKKADENKRLIGECNEKLKDCEDDLISLPMEIDKVNTELMLATMEICYNQLQSNRRKIDEISQWVSQVRTELKEKLILKQDMEQMNQALYSYMHDIFGADVINIFDMEYEKKDGEKARGEEA